MALQPRRHFPCLGPRASARYYSDLKPESLALSCMRTVILRIFWSCRRGSSSLYRMVLLRRQAIGYHAKTSVRFIQLPDRRYTYMLISAPPANAYSVTMKSTSSVHSSLHKSAWDNASVDLPEYSPNTSPVETMAKRPLSIHITVEHATSPPTPISAASTKVSASFPSNFSPASFEFTAIESHHSDIDDMSNVTSAPSVSVVEPKESHP